MKFATFSSYLSRLEMTASRLDMTEILAELLNYSSELDIHYVVNLLLGRLAPQYEGIIFNVAEKMMLQVIAEAYGLPLTEVQSQYKQVGDLGEVAHILAGEQTQSTKQKQLTVVQVFNQLKEVALDDGEGSQERKVSSLARLLSSLDPMSSRYVVRIPLGKLRLGFSDKTVLDGLSWMERGDKSGKKLLDRVYEVHPDVGELAKQVKIYGIEKATQRPTPIVGVPVLPMLAQRLKSPKEMIEKMGEVVVEPKLDGLRILIHYVRGQKGFVKAFTRNLNETSWMFPELASIGDELKANKVIIDCEAVGVDEKRKTLANFQQTMTRRRKHQIAKAATAIPIQFFAFDLIYKDGKSYMNESYINRRRVLENTIHPKQVMRIVDATITAQSGRIRELNKEKQEEGLEGIIVKQTGSTYVSGRTGWRWVKMKESETSVAKLADTLDCVVMGYTQGKGKRTQFGIGQFLAGVVDHNRIVTVTKVGTGLTDDQLADMKKRLKKLEVTQKPQEYEVVKGLIPDFWVTPDLVVELAADEVTKSPKHTSGYALRFPRLVKFRDDKLFSQATTLQELKQLFTLQ